MFFYLFIFLGINIVAPNSVGLAIDLLLPSPLVPLSWLALADRLEDTLYLCFQLKDMFLHFPRCCTKVTSTEQRHHCISMIRTYSFQLSGLFGFLQCSRVRISSVLNGCQEGRKSEERRFNKLVMFFSEEFVFTSRRGTSTHPPDSHFL